MALQKIFTAGNSSVVAIPKEFLSSLNLTSGEMVQVENHGDKIIVSKPAKVMKDIKKSDKDFDAWWNSFISENASTLDELANR